MDRVTQYKANPAAEVQAKATGANGQIMGYAAVFNNVDRQGDIIRPGAFSKTIAERITSGKVGLMVRHMANGGDTLETIGVISVATEDAKGLWIEADLFDAQCAQETRKKIMDAPGVFGMSIGYKVVRSSDIVDNDGNYTGKELIELALYEVTITTIPANEETTAEAKSADAGVIEELRQRVAALENSLSRAEDSANTASKAAERKLAQRISAVKNKFREIQVREMQK